MCTEQQTPVQLFCRTGREWHTVSKWLQPRTEKAPRGKPVGQGGPTTVSCLRQQSKRAGARQLAPVPPDLCHRGRLVVIPASAADARENNVLGLMLLLWYHFCTTEAPWLPILALSLT